MMNTIYTIALFAFLPLFAVELASLLYPNFYSDLQITFNQLLSLVPMDFLLTIPTAIWILAIFWAWGRMERILDKRNLAKYKPVPIPATCKYTSNQVSIIVCTVDTLLARCLLTWLANNPLEVLIVTIQEHRDRICSVVANAGLSPTDLAKVGVLASTTKGKRAQLSLGIQHAKGTIIASIDDHITLHPRFLTGMLPCLEDETVGAVGPTVKALIPTDRQDANVITPWEVAAMRVAWNRTPRLLASFAAARWCWILAGTAGIYRAHILKDPLFLQGYNNETWNGKILDVGEDTFISRWLQVRNWKIDIQNLPETLILRTVKTSPDFFKQTFRWERSTIQSHIRSAFEVPQTYNSFYVARKTWERLLRPVYTLCHVLAWAFAFSSGLVGCTLAMVFVLWYALEAYPSYRDFFREYPYTSRYWWAVVGQDFFYVVQDFICWMTLNNTSWEARHVSFQDQIKRQ